MSTADWVVVAILAFGAVKGYLRGFVVEAFSFFGFFIGLIVALQLTIPVSLRFFAESDYFDIIAILVFIVLFILLGLGIKMAAKLIKNARNHYVYSHKSSTPEARNRNKEKYINEKNYIFTDHFELFQPLGFLPW